MFRPEMRRESDHHGARGWRCLTEGSGSNSVFQGRLEEGEPGWRNSVNVKGVVRDWCVESFCWSGRFVWNKDTQSVSSKAPGFGWGACWNRRAWKGWLGLQPLFFLSIVILHKTSELKGEIMLLISLKFTSAEDFYLNMGIEHVYFHSFLKTH